MSEHRGSFRKAAARIALTIATVLVVLPSAGSGAVLASADDARTPVVLFPAFHFTKLLVTVRNQTVAPDCPRSGSFEDWFLNDHPSTTFDQVCRDELLTLRYDDNPSKPMPQRFSNQRGVTVDILDYGKTESAPFYESLYEALEAAGYVRDQDIRVAGYDSRLTPDLGGFLQRTKKLVEDTYRDNGNRPVHLVGHSNGPLYAQYLLTHTTRAWRDKYIHGFTPIAGNFPGQGVIYPVFFTGLNIQDFTFPATQENAESSARMYLSAPSSYMSSADPRIFGDDEIVVQDASSGRTYTPQDYSSLFTDAGLPWAKDIADYYIGFVDFADPSSFPDVDVYAEKGSGIETVVGAVLPDLSVGQVLDPSTAQFFTRDGDVNQEDITNDAVLAWQAMPCFHFSLTDNPGVDHFSLPSDPGVLGRLVADLALPRSQCP
jgi:lecithin-cholesterol acyltransferase